MIFASNLFLSFTVFFCSRYMRFEEENVQVVSPFFGFIVFDSQLLGNEILFFLTQNKEGFLKNPPSLDLPIIPKDFDLPLSLPKAKYISKFHPKKLLKVKTPTKSLFDEIVFFLLLSLLSLGFFLFLFLLIKKLLQIGGKLVIVLQTINAETSNFLVGDNYIYQDRIKEKEETSSISFSCTHYTFDLKKGNYLILTRDIPQHKLKAGMRGFVKHLLDYQKAELLFVYESNFSPDWDKTTLKNFNVTFIPERNNNIKKVSYFFEKTKF